MHDTELVHACIASSGSSIMQQVSPLKSVRFGMHPRECSDNIQW